MCISKMKANDNINKIQLLRNQFLSKIENDWNKKWSKKHGEKFDFQNLKSQNSFLNDLLDDIERDLKAEIGLEATSKILISRDNLRRIFNQKEHIAWQERTKSTLCLYLSYKNWADFEAKNVFENNKENSSGGSIKKNKSYLSNLKAN